MENDEWNESSTRLSFYYGEKSGKIYEKRKGLQGAEMGGLLEKWGKWGYNDSDCVVKSVDCGERSE